MLVSPSLDDLALIIPDLVTSDQPVQELRGCIRSLHHLPLASTFKTQIYAITAVIAFLVLLGLAVSVTRIIQGNFWVVRFQEVVHSRHVLVIPNVRA